MKGTRYGIGVSNILDFGYVPVIHEIRIDGHLASFYIDGTKLFTEGEGIITLIETQKGCYRFDEGAGDTFYDYSGEGNHISAGLTTRATREVEVEDLEIYKFEHEDKCVIEDPISDVKYVLDKLTYDRMQEFEKQVIDIIFSKYGK